MDTDSNNLTGQDGHKEPNAGLVGSEPPQDAQDVHRAGVWAALRAYSSGAGRRQNRLQTKKLVKQKASKTGKDAF